MPQLLHLGVSKSYLCGLIRRDGASRVLANWTGTDDEAIAAVEADGREVFAIGPCDNQDATGLCRGHDPV